MKKYLVIALLAPLFSCEEEVAVDLKEAPAAYVVDAWVNDKLEEQTIKLSLTQDYFDSSEPTPISGATVQIIDDNNTVFVFSETLPGSYTWNPATTTDRIEGIDTQYQLDISVNGISLTANSQLNRVPPIDSIKFTYKEEQNMFQPAGYYGEFVATDPVGPGDSYWIKSFKNGTLLNSPFDLNIAFDAGFNQGGNIDGVVFIQPIQDAVTPLNNDLDKIVPYVPGDSLYVELHAITNEAFDFLQQVQIQTQRDGGFDEIFAEPLENVITNINITTQDTDLKVIGFFNVASVSGRGRRLVE